MRGGAEFAQRGILSERSRRYIPGMRSLACTDTAAVPESGVAGGWVGYVYAMVACGGCAAVALGSTLFLYVFGRSRGREPRVRVQSLNREE